MATVDLGRIKFVWQGTWSSSTAYVVDDVVYNDGSAYVCILASTNNEPPNATYWSKMAQGSDLGSLASLAQGDIAFYDGTDWARLGAGTSGQYLETKGSSADPVWSTVTSTGRLINSATVLHATNYTLTNSADSEFSTGTNLSYTPQESGSTVMAFVEADFQVTNTTSDNDSRTTFRVGTVNSSGTTVFTTSENASSNAVLGNTNNSVNSGTHYGLLTRWIEDCERNSSGNVVVKIKSVSNFDPDCTVTLAGTLITFMEYSA
mgnify:CR=1 FL=1